MSETTTRTITAAEAGQDEALWEAVQAQCVEVTDSYGRIIGRPCPGPPDSDPWFERGEFQWLFKSMGFGVVPAHSLFVVRNMDPADQSPNSPAAVERLQARIVELEQANERLTLEAANLREFLRQAGFEDDGTPTALSEVKP